MLPLAAVATVSRGAVVLDLDRRAIKATGAARAPAEVKPAAMTPAADEDEDWGTRITRYLGADQGNTETARSAGDEEGKTEEGMGRPAMTRAEQPSFNSSEDAGIPAGPYLQFVSTPSGYQLLEQQGPAPAAFDHVEMREHDGRFWVAKLAISPLPNDSRLCAYLERIE